MPRPKSNNPKPSWKSQYSEHDVRAGGETRRVSFKNSRLGPKRDNKDWTASIRAHLQDEDVDMGISNVGGGRNYSKKHFTGKRGHRSDSPAPRYQRGGPMNKKLLEGPINWYRVFLPHGNKYEKDFVIRTLMQKIEPLPLWPIMWKANGPTSTFYVDEIKVARKLMELDRQIEMPDGFKLLIKVNSGYPPVDISTEVKDKMKVVMAKRYNIAAKALDLTKFHADPDLQEYFCAIFKPIVFLTIIDIIVENIPDIEAMNLCDNKISNLSYLKKIKDKLPNLKILHMADNKFKEISALDPLIGLPLVDLILNGNPLCSKFKDEESYICEVRKKFPKVIKLDGQDLPPPISFDIAADVNLPPSKQTFLCQQDGGDVVRRFLEQYFLIYDSNSRKPLLAAYHESALFSMTMGYPYGHRKDKNTSWLNWYTTENRNLLITVDSDRRSKLIKQGNLQVVSFLQDMPQSQHDMNSFTVDMALCVPQMISFSLTGYFKELSQNTERTSRKTPPIRYFFRSFVLVPAGSGFCVINETLHITNVTDEQAKVAFKIPLAAPPATVIGASPVAGVPPTPVTSPVAVPSPSVAVPPVIDDVMKQQMVQALAQQSNMNLEWSAKCLMETQWDFQRAISVFTDLNNQGKIPAEAFIK